MSEADLKQRREILNGQLVYTDAAPVRAALNGRLLVLDGIEKAERNVLPTLNNLLENREMQLPDGRFMVSPSRFENINCSARDCRSGAGQLVSTHPDFLVVALGLPVPRYALRLSRAEPPHFDLPAAKEGETPGIGENGWNGTPK